MKLSEYKQDYDALTGKASDVARHLAFAGIAIVWIFRSGEGTAVKLPDQLVFALSLFGAALLFDLLHYVVASVIWGSFHRQEEQKLSGAAEDPDVDAPAWHNRPAIVFFALKIVAVVVGYVVMLVFLLSSCSH